jgi:hypothetical protein
MPSKEVFSVSRLQRLADKMKHFDNFGLYFHYFCGMIQTINCLFFSTETSSSPKITDYFPKKENFVVLDSESSNESKQKDETVQKNKEQISKEIQSKSSKKNDVMHHLVIEVDSFNNQQQTDPILNDKEVKVGYDKAPDKIVSCHNDPVSLNIQITPRIISTVSSTNNNNNNNNTEQKLTEERISKHAKKKTSKERKRKFLPELRIGEYSSNILDTFHGFYENSLLFILNNSTAIESGQRSQ